MEIFSWSLSLPPLGTLANVAMIFSSRLKEAKWHVIMCHGHGHACMILHAYIHRVGGVKLLLRA